MKNKVKIEQSEPPVERVVLAQAIVDASAAMKKLVASGLNARAIRLLVSDHSGVNQTQVRLVIESLSTLAENYCEPTPRRKAGA